MADTWEEAADETAATLKRDVIKMWTEHDVDPLNATRQVLASMGDEPGQYPAVQGFRHIAENGIVGYLKHRLHGVPLGPFSTVEDSIEHVVQTVINKQHDYGHGNIEAYGRLGLLVRLSDKCARIDNLEKRGATGLNESLEDSWLDIAGYGIIGCMFELGTFMLPLAADAASDNVVPLFNSELPTGAFEWDDHVKDLIHRELRELGLV